MQGLPRRRRWRASPPGRFAGTAVVSNSGRLHSQPYYTRIGRLASTAISSARDSARARHIRTTASPADRTRSRCTGARRRSTIAASTNLGEDGRRGLVPGFSGPARRTVAAAGSGARGGRDAPAVPGLTSRGDIGVPSPTTRASERPESCRDYLRKPDFPECGESEDPFTSEVAVGPPCTARPKGDGRVSRSPPRRRAPRAYLPCSPAAGGASVDRRSQPRLDGGAHLFAVVVHLHLDERARGDVYVMAVEAVGARVREADARQGTACPRAVEDLVAAVQIRAAQLVQVVVVEERRRRQARAVVHHAHR